MFFVTNLNRFCFSYKFQNQYFAYELKKRLTILLLLSFFWGISQRGYFIENKGQLPENVLFNAKLNYGNFFIEKDGSFKIKVLNPNQVNRIFGHKHEKKHQSHVKGHFHSNLIKGHSFKVKFIDANFSKNFISKSAGNFQINLFKGQYPDSWVSNLRPYSEITLKDVYPKTDLKIYFKNNSIKYEFILHPSAEPKNIKIQYLGLQEINFSPKKLILKTSVGNITDENPKSFFQSQPLKNIATSFQKINSNTFGLEIGIQTINESLIVDPQLNFSSFTGATLDNWGYTATYDDAGYAYSGGIAFDGGYPTTLGTFQSTYGEGEIDMTISKFSPDGKDLIYSTYIGGSGLEAPHSMIVNSNNELVIYGITSSPNYPVSTNAYDKTFNGGTAVLVSNILNFESGTDIVVTKLSVNGNEILGSTYYGGSGNDALNDASNLSGLSHNYADDYRGEVNTDNTNNIFISSVTSSSDLPTPNGFQTTYGGGFQDGCVAKFNQDLSEIIWGSYFGGSNDDACYASKQNSTGETYITGGSNSNNLTLNGRSSNNNGGIDGFIARIAGNGSTILNGTFVGTSSYDQSYFVEVDYEDKVYCFGQSLGNMPTTNGVYKNLNSKQFVQKYSEDLFTLEASTIVGSENGLINIVPSAFMISNCKEVYLSGWGGIVNNDSLGTQNMPISPDAHQNSTDGSDFYFMVLGPDFSSLKYGSYFGGQTLTEHVDGGTSRFDKSGTIYQAVCAGCGGSSAFPITPSAYSATNNSSNCNLAVIKMDISKLTANIKFTKDSTHCENSPVILTNESTGGTEYKWIYPDGSISQSFNGEFFFEDTGKFLIQLIAIDSIQCPYSDTAKTVIEVIKTPEISIEIDTFLCINDSLIINSIGGPNDNNYKWWSGNSTFDINGSNLNVKPDSTTEYFVEYKNKCGTDTSKVEIPVFYPPTSSSLIDTVCNGGAQSSYFSVYSNYIITELNNKPFEIKNDSIYFPKNITDTYYINTESNCGNSIDTFDIKQLTVPNISIDFDDFSCANDSLTIKTTGGPTDTNYTWWSKNTTYSINDPNLNVQPDTTTEYFVEYRNKCGTDTSKTKIPAFEPPTSALIIDTVCENESTEQYFQSNSTDIITEKNNKPFQLINDTISFPKNINDIYYINTKSFCGNSIDTFNININEIEKKSTPDTTICPGSRIELYVDGGDEYFWRSPELEDNSNDSSIIIYPTKNQIYPNIIYKGNCMTYDTVKIDVFPIPDQEIDQEQIIHFGQSFSVNLNPKYEYSWTPRDFLICNNNCQSINATPNEDIIYYLIYNDENGCSHKDSIIAKVIFPIFIPNTFTPNGDGKNDVFYAYSKVLEQYELLIYDRWGNLAFKTEDLSKGWDGRINGNPQPQDVYVYKLNYILKYTRNWREKVGTVTLIR